MLVTNTFGWLFLVFSQFIANSALEDGATRQYVPDKSYNYNHPPSFEENNSFTDELKTRKVRQTEHINEESQKHSQVSNSLTGTIENMDGSQNTSKILTVSSQISGVVSSGSNVDLQRSNDKPSSNTTNKIKKRKRARRPNASKTDNVVNLHKSQELSTVKTESTRTTKRFSSTSLDPKKYLSTPKVQTTSTTERISTSTQGAKTIVPKVFTKRPPEDNPVVKNVRQRDPVVKILEATNFVYAHNGNFHYSFEGADGTKVSSEGELKSFDDKKTGEAVVGNVFYKDNDGNDFSLSYTADENGYRPQGAHLPTPPPIPPAIARALAYLATKTTPMPVTEPST